VVNHLNITKRLPVQRWHLVTNEGCLSQSRQLQPGVTCFVYNPHLLDIVQYSHQRITLRASEDSHLVYSRNDDLHRRSCQKLRLNYTYICQAPTSSSVFTAVCDTLSETIFRHFRLCSGLPLVRSSAFKSTEEVKITVTKQINWNQSQESL